jgi:adenine-specific DNA-methyltransferase
MNKLDMESKQIISDNLEVIKKMFPNCFSEEKLDFDMLKQELSAYLIDDKKEKYQLTWPGKKEAIANSNSSISNTLRPLKEKSVDFDKTKNIYIEGDNLEALKLLQESYLNKIKCIYIDPPYNTGNDFIYNDDFSKSSLDELYDAGEIDENGNRLVTNNKSNGRFHSDWLSMMYSRIKLARNLLTEDGAIFISIDDNEIENLRKICDEIFGEVNFIAQFIWKKKQGGGNDSSFVVAEHEYILCFCKNYNSFSLNLDKNYQLSDSLYPYKDEKGEYGLITLDKASIQFSQSLVFDIKGPDGKIYTPRVVKGKQSCWRWSKSKVEQQYDELVFKNDKVYTKYYRPEGVTPKSLLVDALYGRTESGNDDIKALFEINPFSYPKPVLLVKHFVSIASNDGDIILDFFSGSGTTAQAVMKLNSEENTNRKFILVQLPEECSENSDGYKAGYKTICEIGEERIRRAGKKIKEETNANIDYGFRVYKIDSSNMKDVFYKPSEVEQMNLLDYLSNIKDDRTPEDLLTQVMLDLGLTLDLKIEEKSILSNKVFYVEDNSLVACFDDQVDINIIDEICKCNPMKVVFKDISFKTDKDKINLEERIKKLSPETEINIL